MKTHLNTTNFTIIIALTVFTLIFSCRKSDLYDSSDRTPGNMSLARMSEEDLSDEMNHFIYQTLQTNPSYQAYEGRDAVLIFEAALNYHKCTPGEDYTEIEQDFDEMEVTLYKNESNEYEVRAQDIAQYYADLTTIVTQAVTRVEFDDPDSPFNIVVDLEFAHFTPDPDQNTYAAVIKVNTWVANNAGGSFNCEYGSNDYWKATSFGGNSGGCNGNTNTTSIAWRQIMKRLSSICTEFPACANKYASFVYKKDFDGLSPSPTNPNPFCPTPYLWYGSNHSECISPSDMQCYTDGAKYLANINKGNSGDQIFGYWIMQSFNSTPTMIYKWKVEVTYGICSTYQWNKMKKFYLHLLLSFSLTGHIFAQSFSFSYSTNKDEFPRDVIQDSSGNYYVAVNHGTFNNNSVYECKILKVNNFGVIVDSLLLSVASGTKSISNLIILSDGSIMGVGLIRLPGHYDIQIYLVRFTQQLNLIYEKVYGEADADDYPQVIRFVSPGLLSILNTRIRHSTMDGGVVIYMLNESGDSLAAHTYDPDSGFQWGSDLLINQTHNREIYVFARGWAVQTPMPPVYSNILVVDSLWNLIKVVGVPKHEGDQQARRIDSNNLLIADRVFGSSGFPKPFDIRFTTFDSTLTQTWINDFGKPDTSELNALYGLDFIDTSSVWLGYTQNSYDTDVIPPVSFRSWYYLNNCNSKGEKIWERWYHLNDNYLMLYKVLATRDGGVLLAGSSYNSQTAAGQERDLYILKLDSLGNFVTSVPGINVQPTNIKIFPNPFTTTLRIQTSLTTPADYAIHDATGKLLTGGVLKNTSDSEIDLSAIPAGVHFVTLSTGGRPVARQRVVKQ
jgi:hypothetical protein